MARGLRERKKSQKRAALLSAAHTLFEEKGYQATTIDEIAEAAGVSRRTFFRYFPTKEDIVFPRRETRLAELLVLLEMRQSGEGVFATLRRLTTSFANEFTENSERIIARQALVKSSPDLLARERAIDRAWEVTMADYLTKWGGGGREAQHRARVLAGASIGVIRATLRYWFDSGGKEDLNQLGQEALDYLEQGFMGVFKKP